MTLKTRTLKECFSELVDRMEVSCLVQDEMEVGNKWEAIRLLYKLEDKAIRNRGSTYGIDPYVIDWSMLFTPIEMDAWCSIRGCGLPLYPQYPVDRFFVDFGDPVKRIALECDGKAYHDEAKDYERDLQLAKLGWVVFRVTGSECHRAGVDISELVYDYSVNNIEADEFEYKLYDWSMNTSDGVIYAINETYYRPKLSQKARKYFPDTLRAHSFMEV